MAASIYPARAITASGSQGDDGKISEEATLNLMAVVDSSSDNELAVRTALVSAGYTYGSAHPVLGAGYRLRNRAINKAENTVLVYEISLTYRTPKLDPDKPEDTPPWMLRTKVNFSPSTVDEPIDEDWDGNAIQTTANEPLQGITRPISDLVIRLERAFESFDPVDFYTYSDVVNADTFLGFVPGLLRAGPPTANESYWNEYLYYTVSQDIFVRKPYRDIEPQYAWYKRVLNQGFFFRPTAGATPVSAPGQSPILLASNGTRLADGAEPHYLMFKIFDSVNFAGMGWF